MYKTHNCGELRRSDVGKEVELAGWVHRRCDHGGVAFIDLRDRFGLTQVVADPTISPQAHEALDAARSEWVLKIEGIVRPRPEGSANPNLATGDIEVEVNKVTVLNQAKTPPFAINKEEDVDENTRLRYRYMDLRRERMSRNLVLRHKVVKFIRDYLTERDFIEVEKGDYIYMAPYCPQTFYATGWDESRYILYKDVNRDYVRDL